MVSSSNCHEVMRLDAMILVFECQVLRQHILSSHFYKRVFSSSSLSAIKVVLSVYLRLLIALLEILIPACASSSQAFHMMYSVYKLNKQNDSMDVPLSQFGTSLLFHVQF